MAKEFRSLSSDGVLDMVFEESAESKLKASFKRELSDMLGRDPNLSVLAESWGSFGLERYISVGLGYSEGWYGTRYLSTGCFGSTSLGSIHRDLKAFTVGNPFEDFDTFFVSVIVTSYNDNDVRIIINHPSQSVALRVSNSDFSHPTIEPDFHCESLPLEFLNICKTVPELINSSLKMWSEEIKNNKLPLTEIDLVFSISNDGSLLGDLNLELGISNAMSEDSEYYEDDTKAGTYRMAYISYPSKKKRK